MNQHAAPSDSQALVPLSFPLQGSRLIEASAGTGKTWTIAALYLRLVLGHNTQAGLTRPLLPSEILVMTFTRSATRELSERIRERLLQAAQCFRDQTPVDPDDNFLASLIAEYPDGVQRSQAAWRLSMAAETMDEAAVHTIDAWCQRMLKEHAFDCGSLFDEELLADEDGMRSDASTDYWRQQCYPLCAEALSAVLLVWKSVAALISDMRSLIEKDIPEHDGRGTLAEVVQRVSTERTQAIEALKAAWKGRAQEMQDWLDEQLRSSKGDWDGKRLSQGHYTKWLAALENWCQRGHDLEVPEMGAGWQRFTPAGLSYARKAAAAPIQLPVVFSEFEQFTIVFDHLPDLRDTISRHAAFWIARRMADLKRQTGTFGFADMLQRLDAALRAAGSGERLRNRILAQYPVAMIDEFQDTSPLQYRIFDQIYHTASNDSASALLLIGDPKQSIYGFRGADIYSYIQARRATTGRHYALATNFRSTQPLVEAVNHLFARADAAPNHGAFLFREGEDNPLPFVEVQARGRAEHLREAQGLVPAMTLVHDLAQLRSGTAMRERFAALCAQQVVTWLNDAQAGFDVAGQPFKRMRPTDIAVLVRTGKEAAAVRRALRRRRVASVYLSDKDSVFDSDEARDILRWLRAVSMPRDVRLVRAALATHMIGLSVDQLGWLATNEEAFDQRSETLQALQGTWQVQGVLAMLRQSLHQFDLPARWLQQPDGERRLTNYLHLAELLQTASGTLDGEQALIRWLLNQRVAGGVSGDEQIVRLESDDDLVKVVTIHKSKGLEYPIVCLPFVTSFRPFTERDATFMDLPDDDGHRRLLLTLDDAAVARADRERLKEDLRLLYVALTRARHALWVGFSSIKIGNGKSCQSHRSALGYLLDGGDAIAQTEWLQRLQDFQLGQSGIRLVAAPDEIAQSSLARTDSLSALQVISPYKADFDRSWTIGSFSGLTKDLIPQASQLSVLKALRPADDEISADDPAALSEGTAVARSAESVLTPIGWHQFQAGSVAGNFLHEQLQWLAGEKFALTTQPELLDRLRRRCERAGREAQADIVAEWLTAVVQLDLPGPGVALNKLECLLPEMEFWLPARAIESRKIDALCREHLLDGAHRPTLPDRALHGMLMGWADLIFEHEGRYWVLDYKSNRLGPTDQAYDRAALVKAMAEHRYDLQAAIYMLALHRLLRRRLGSAYDPAGQLGGAVYLFLRGIQGPEQGVYIVPPSIPLLEGLDAMLTQETESA